VPRASKKTRAKQTLRAYAIELVLYAVMVTIYFFAVLHFLADWLYKTEQRHITLYAFVALALIVGQAVAFEAITTALLKWLQGGRSE